jgi:hypothetical protein
MKKTPSKHQPWLKWYPADWRAEPRLKMVSRAARSLWIDMIGLMHEAEPYGFLIVGNVPLKTAADLSRALGDREDDVAPLLDELDRAVVFSRNRNGVIYSRRMMRDRKKRDNSSKGGKIGGLTTYENKKGIFSTQAPTQGVTQAPEARSQSSLLRKAADAADDGLGKQPLKDPKSWLFRDGLSWLAKATGRNEKGLRSQLGKWLRDAKEDSAALRAIFESAQQQDVAEPIAWITRTIKTRQQAASPFEQTDEHGWRKRFQAYRTNGAWPATWGGAKPGDHPQHPAHLLAEYGYGKNAA